MQFKSAQMHHIRVSDIALLCNANVDFHLQHTFTPRQCSQFRSLIAVAKEIPCEKVNALEIIFTTIRLYLRSVQTFD
jgi:hypothetical protein